jgi:hypothetical protein
LSETSLVTAAQSEGLLREIEQQAKDECRAVFEAAERESQVLVTQAYKNARRRTKEAIAELRREGDRRLARARAQAETEERQRFQQAAAEAIRQAWPLLAEALVARWSDPAARLAWIGSAARQARERMHGDGWHIEHPADLNADEQGHFRQALGVADDAVTFTLNRDIAAGIRIRATQAMLDASIQGLLADAHTIEALLLAEIVPANGGEGPALDGAKP